MNKKVIISLSAIAILLLIWLISKINCSSDIPNLPKWEGSADEIIINRSDETVKVFKKDKKWLVGEEGFPADTGAVKELDSRFKDLRVVNLVSKRGFYSKYDLTPDKHIEVIIKKDDEIFRKFKVGKKSSTNRHTYMRIDDWPGIYMVEGIFDMMLKKTVDDLRDKDIFKISRDAVTAFEVNCMGRVFSFTREKQQVEEKNATEKKDPSSSGIDKTIPEKKAVEKWVCRGHEGVSIDKNRIEGLLSSFDPLKAATFPEAKKDELGHYTCNVKISAFGKDITLSIYQKKDNRYTATSSESPYVFSLDEWRVKKFFIKGLDEFREKGK